MKIDTTYTSPNFKLQTLEPEFIILHYTACSLKKTLEIFLSPQTQVTAHFVIDTDGTCYDLGGFLNGPILQGAHAGKSECEIEGKHYSSFNMFSIGIEIVNFNGNQFDYTEEQYQTLHDLISKLQERFPILQNSHHIIGHEHIAGFRGKCDPGVKFDWEKLLSSLDMPTQMLHRRHACNEGDILFIRDSVKSANLYPENFWPELSLALEKRIAERVSN